MHKLGFCFRCSRCSCKEEELELEGEKKNLKNSLKIDNTWKGTCVKKANMEIHTNKLITTSSSSKQSTPIMEFHPTLEDIQIAYKKLQSLRSESPIMNFYTPSTGGLRYSSNVSNNEGIVGSEPQVAPCNVSIPSGYECLYLMQGKHLSPNKIANYRGPLSTKSNTPTFSNSSEVPSFVALQKLQKKKSNNKWKQVNSSQTRLHYIYVPPDPHLLPP